MCERGRDLASWAVVPMVVVMQFFDLRRSLVGPGWVYSAYLVGFGLVVLVGLPLVWSRLSQLGRRGWLVLGAFTVLLVWASVSVLVSGEDTYPMQQRSHGAGKPLLPGQGPQQWEHRLVPLLTAWVTMAAAVVVVLLIPRARRVSRLWVTSWVLLVTSVAAWPRAIGVHGSVRVATGMGGSAVLHLVFLLCSGVFLGAAAQGFRRRWSLVGALFSAGLLVLTGSRAALASLVVMAVLVAGWLGGRVRARVWALALAGLAVMGVLVVALVPALRRVLDPTDDLRGENLATAWSVATSDWTHTVFGVGSGRLWPWYAYDARLLNVPWRGRVQTPAGMVQTNPHSVPLGVGVELGLVGLVLLGLIVAALVVTVARARRHHQGLGTARDGVALALVASLTAFLFDYYLFKNFGVSWWWWVCLVVVLTAPVSPGTLSSRAAGQGPDVQMQAVSVDGS